MASVAPPRKPVVLIVDDEFLLRMHAADIAREAGYEVIEAVDADDAIVKLETNPSISVLFTDIQMPGSMDGMRLASAVRDRWPPVNMILVSGFRRPEPEGLPERSVFFSKPYSEVEIVRALRSFA